MHEEFHLGRSTEHAAVKELNRGSDAEPAALAIKFWKSSYSRYGHQNPAQVSSSEFDRAFMVKPEQIVW